MIIIDETLQEEESDTTRKEGHKKRTDGTKIVLQACGTCPGNQFRSLPVPVGSY